MDSKTVIKKAKGDGGEDEEEEKNNEEISMVDEINAEFALADAMDNLLQYLKMRDLCRVAQVCRSWNEAAKLEMSKRGIERILIPDTYDKNIITSAVLKKPPYHVSTILNSKPHVFILFVGPRPHLRKNLNLEFDILDIYKSNFPNRMIVVGVDASMKDDEEIRSSPYNFGDIYAANGILGLVIPEYRRSRIKIGYCESHEHRVKAKARRIVNQLIPDHNDNGHSTILLFGRSYYSIAHEVTSLIEKRFENRSYSIWGFTSQNFVKTIDCTDDEDYPNYRGMEACIGVNIITDSGFNSWNLFLDTRLKRTEVEHKLTNFAAGLRLKKRTIGLLCGPKGLRDVGLIATSCQKFDHVELLNMARTALPGIPFIGSFNDTEDYYFGKDSESPDHNMKLAQQHYASIMILTYD